MTIPEKCREFIKELDDFIEAHQGPREVDELIAQHQALSLEVEGLLILKELIAEDLVLLKEKRDQLMREVMALQFLSAMETALEMGSIIKHIGDLWPTS